MLSCLSMVRWSSGQDVALSRRKHGFESRTNCSKDGRVSGGPFFVPICFDFYKAALSLFHFFPVEGHSRISQIPTLLILSCTANRRQSTRNVLTCGAHGRRFSVSLSGLLADLITRATQNSDRTSAGSRSSNSCLRARDFARAPT